MMDCLKSNELMNAYLDDFLNESEKQEFLEHIDICPKCQKELDEMRLMLDILHDTGKIEKEPPQELKNSVIRVLMVQQAPTKIIAFWRPFAAIAAGIVIIIALYSSGILTNSTNFLSPQKSTANYAPPISNNGTLSSPSTLTQENTSSKSEQKTQQNVSPLTSQTIVGSSVNSTANNISKAGASTEYKSAVSTTSSPNATVTSSNVAPNITSIATLDKASINQDDLKNFIPISTDSTDNNTKEYLLTEKQLNDFSTKYKNLKIRSTATATYAGSNTSSTQTYCKLEIIG
jgi:predicted anti-sigma-YlaC factor YlaD